MADEKTNIVASSEPQGPAPGLAPGPGRVPIPAPYSRATETLPLNQASKRRNWWCSSQESDGLNMIVGFFAIFTVSVTIALIVQIHYGAFEVSPHGSVATDSEDCSYLGVQLLRRGGNAIDAAVAATICMGVVHPHMTGIGGGGFLLAYDHKKRQVLNVIDFREVAPENLPSDSASIDGSASVGVPGLLRGLALAHQMYGNLPWRDIVEPSIQLAREGVVVSESLLNSRNPAGLGPVGNAAFHALLEQIRQGQVLLQPRLADALEAIADQGANALYNGSLTSTLLSAISAQSLMTSKDLASYRAEEREPLVGEVGDYTVMVPGAPSGGPLLLAALGVLGSPENNPDWWGDQNPASRLQKLAGTLRLAALYHAQLGDPDQSPETVLNATIHMTDPGGLATLRKEVEEGGSWSNWELPQPAGTHVGVIDTDDLYVSVVSGLNSIFGSRILTSSGFVLNDALENFTPQTSVATEEGNNYGSPGRRPLSLSVPVVVVPKNSPCGQRLVLGSVDAGVATQALVSVLSVHRDIGEAIEQPRVTLHSKNLSVENLHTPLIPDDTITQLERMGYKVQLINPPYVGVNIVQKVGDTLSAHSDSRGGGGALSY